MPDQVRQNRGQGRDRKVAKTALFKPHKERIEALALTTFVPSQERLERQLFANSLLPLSYRLAVLQVMIQTRSSLCGSESSTPIAFVWAEEHENQQWDLKSLIECNVFDWCKTKITTVEAKQQKALSIPPPPPPPPRKMAAETLQFLDSLLAPDRELFSQLERTFEKQFKAWRRQLFLNWILPLCFRQAVLQVAMEWSLHKSPRRIEDLDMLNEYTKTIQEVWARDMNIADLSEVRDNEIMDWCVDKAGSVILDYKARKVCDMVRSKSGGLGSPASYFVSFESTDSLPSL